MNKIDPEHCAFAAQSYNPNLEKTFQQKGLTKREYFAAMAMQGILSCSHQHQSATYESVSMEASSYADALINELNKQP